MADVMKNKFKPNESPESQILSHLSSEIKASLHGIMGFTHLLGSQRSGNLNGKQTRYVSEIYESGKRLDSLVNDYIDFTRIEAGMLQLHFSGLDVNEYLLWALDVLERKLTQKKIKFSVVWETPSEKIQGDSARFKQILYIVLSNAVECAHDEEQLLLNVSFSEGFLKVCLKNDSSIIISTKSLNGTYPSNDPQGIGQEDNPLNVRLALAQKLIQLHGGDMGLDYDEKGGSQLWFTIPIQQVPSPDPRGKETESQVKPGSHPLRILLVDDNNNIQNLVSDFLLKEKYKVFVADNGRIGLEMAKHCRPDLIFMDINMPIMDGAEAIQNLRNLPGFAKTPVVALSAYEKEDMGGEFYKLGFTHYLNKPFSKSDLIEAIHTCVAAE